MQQLTITKYMNSKHCQSVFGRTESLVSSRHCASFFKCRRTPINAVCSMFILVATTHQHVRGWSVSLRSCRVGRHWCSHVQVNISRYNRRRRTVSSNRAVARLPWRHVARTKRSHPRHTQLTVWRIVIRWSKKYRPSERKQNLTAVHYLNATTVLH